MKIPKNYMQGSTNNVLLSYPSSFISNKLKYTCRTVRTQEKQRY